MKISAKITGRGPIPGNALAHVTVVVQFDGPIESMKITVTVPAQGTDEATQAQGIARAKELARQLSSR